ncbi:golgin IMH1-like isoform X1 [Cimex lectularius]|uniref:Uncharacterized protein n=1 Tax=Cimex lectularius TaxID=79782 RepID=A0A8I6SDB8_CIMLE|nr:golgin IMH1-like isoform X1 [Cimex lectularius]
MAIAKKDVALKIRLDNLEAELKNLHATILQKRLSRHSLHQQPVKSSTKPEKPQSGTIKTCQKLWSKDGAKQEREDGKEWYSCLQSITDSIARGSKAIRTIASLTNDSNSSNSNSVSENKNKEELLTISDNTLEGITDAVYENRELDTPNSVRVPQHGALRKAASHHVTESKKPIRKVKSSGNENTAAMSSYQSLNDCKLQLLKENHMLKQKLVSMNNIVDEVNDLKKKLKEEQAKRTAAEKLSKADKNTSAIDIIEPPVKTNSQTKKMMQLQNELRDEKARRMRAETNLMERSTCNKATNSPGFFENADFMEKVKLKMEYIEEKQRREEVEKELMMVLEKLEESEYRSMDLAESKKIALAMADKFRHKCESYSNLQLDKGGGDIELATALRNQQHQNVQLLNELRDLRGTQECKMYEKYKKLADSLQEEVDFLRNNMKNPLEDPKVKALVEKHKIAYGELLLAKNAMESEYEEKFRTFEDELQGLQDIHDSKVFELTGIIQNLKVKLQEKNECIASFNSEQSAYNDAIKRIKSRYGHFIAGDLSAINKQQDDIIKVLKENIAEKDKSLEVMEQELASMHEGSETLRKDVKDLRTKLNEAIGENNMLHDELKKGHDTVVIKEKIIIDQLDTIKSLRTMADNSNKTITDLRKERDNLLNKLTEIEEMNRNLQDTVQSVQDQVNELEKYKEGQEKNAHILKQLESQVFQRQKEWESNIAQMCKEKDQAIQTAKFATQKLVQAVNDYEAQLASQKKLQMILNNAIQEKEEQLKIALQQLDVMNEDTWQVQKSAESTRTDLKQKLRKACEVCPDVIEDYPIGEPTYKKSS